MSADTELAVGQGVQAGERLLIPVVRRQWFISAKVGTGSLQTVALAILEGDILSVGLMDEGVAREEILRLLGVASPQEPE
jgi:hypothetical protein